MYINKSPRRIDRKAGGCNKKVKIKSYPKTNKKQKRFSSKFINQASSLFPGNIDTEMVWNFLDKVEGVKKITLPETKNQNLKMRLTLDYEEDYWLLESVRKILGNSATRDKVDKLFVTNPDMYKLNWFRNEEWKNEQLSRML